MGSPLSGEWAECKPASSDPAQYEPACPLVQRDCRMGDTAGKVSTLGFTSAATSPAQPCNPVLSLSKHAGQRPAFDEPGRGGELISAARSRSNHSLDGLGCLLSWGWSQGHDHLQAGQIRVATCAV